MSGRIDSGFLWLDKALQRGYLDEYTLQSNQELILLREDGRFEQLMARYFSAKR
jgi:hypothetical protein